MTRSYRNHSIVSSCKLLILRVRDVSARSPGYLIARSGIIPQGVLFLISGQSR